MRTVVLYRWACRWACRGLSTAVGRNGVSLKFLYASDKPKIYNISGQTRLGRLLVYPDCDAYIFASKHPGMDLLSVATTGDK
jgi:hypothetical protein